MERNIITYRPHKKMDSSSKSQTQTSKHSISPPRPELFVRIPEYSSVPPSLSTSVPYTTDPVQDVIQPIVGSFVGGRLILANRAAIPTIISKNDPNELIVISLVPSMEPIVGLGENHRTHWVHDNCSNIEQMKNIIRSNVRWILSILTNPVMNKTIVVHCEGGVSRSVTLIAAIILQHSYDINRPIVDYYALIEHIKAARFNSTTQQHSQRTDPNFGFATLLMAFIKKGSLFAD